VGNEPYDAVLDLQGLLKSALFVRAARSELKLGYHWMREGAWLFSQRVLPDPSSVHVVDQYVDVARAAGGEADNAFFDLHAHFDDLEEVEQKLRFRGVGERFVVMNAGAGWASKRWPAQHFAKLADMLALAHVQTVFLGGPGDQTVLEEVRALGAKEAISMVGETNVRELIALISLATLHIGGDTGSTHIAAALGKPSIGLYSLTRPERTGPYGQIHNCLFDARSLANIEVESVFGRVLEVLN
jgi:ADP-heptose:LPS heptosyltransferase